MTGCHFFVNTREARGSEFCGGLGMSQVGHIPFSRPRDVSSHFNRFASIRDVDFGALYGLRYAPARTAPGTPRTPASKASVEGVRRDVDTPPGIVVPGG